MLQNYETDLKKLKAELVSYEVSIPVLMQAMSREGDGSIFSFASRCIMSEGAMAFSNAWHRYLNEHGVFLEEQEYHAVNALGDVLGRYTIEEQAAAIDHSLSVLSAGRKEHTDKLHSVTRLYLGTAIALSAMLVVLLL